MGAFKRCGEVAAKHLQVGQHATDASPGWILLMTEDAVHQNVSGPQT